MSSEGSTEKLGIGLCPFAEDIYVDDVQFVKHPNSVLVEAVCEYYFDRRTVAVRCWLVTKFSKLRGRLNLDAIGPFFDLFE